MIKFPPENFSWNSYKPYRAYDRLLQNLVIDKKSVLTIEGESINLKSALEDIRERFVDNFDEGKRGFEEKVFDQFNGASNNTRLVFSHIEYLWAMPVGNIGKVKKRAYALRWFSEDQIINSSEIFLGDGDQIANPGQFYLTNKYNELLALVHLLGAILKEGESWSLGSLKLFIENTVTISYT